ncbi:MAG: hypothetical protein GEV28_40295 [Actinophytocola sp.]|uniref:hypothetical protein n=1 Tax=Actinophytocola sp. TaxID=1872138 RepID=UPI00132093C6|nr:hypothetical protein [Actinophytocola sp.]MPZ86281.1 hypothetical protein [Actinophytocola sp.]
MDAELYESLTELGRAGYLVHTYQVDHDGPMVVAMVLDRGGCADVFILHDEHRAYAYRTPNGAGRDVLNPAVVFWDCPGKPVRAGRALLDLPAPGEKDVRIVLRAPKSRLCLPVERRGPNLSIRRRGT